MCEVLTNTGELASIREATEIMERSYTIPLPIHTLNKLQLIKFT